MPWWISFLWNLLFRILCHWIQLYPGIMLPLIQPTSIFHHCLYVFVIIQFLSTSTPTNNIINLFDIHFQILAPEEDHQSDRAFRGLVPLDISAARRTRAVRPPMRTCALTELRLREVREQSQSENTTLTVDQTNIQPKNFFNFRLCERPLWNWILVLEWSLLCFHFQSAQVS